MPNVSEALDGPQTVDPLLKQDIRLPFLTLYLLVFPESFE
jgi:hypothetical protein